MIENSIHRIKVWLDKNANKVLKSLHKKASIEEISYLEQTIGRTLPKDFKDLYFTFNGLDQSENFGSLFFCMDFYSVDRIIENYQYFRKNQSDTNIFKLEKFDNEINESDMVNPYWVCFSFDGSHTGLYLDLDPSKYGKYGQVIFVDSEYQVGIKIADSVSEFLCSFANDLESDMYFLNPDALDDDNHFLSIKKSNDIINWKTSVKWKKWTL